MYNFIKIFLEVAVNLSNQNITLPIALFQFGTAYQMMWWWLIILIYLRTT